MGLLEERKQQKHSVGGAQTRRFRVAFGCEALLEHGESHGRAHGDGVDAAAAATAKGGHYGAIDADAVRDGPGLAQCYDRRTAQNTRSAQKTVKKKDCRWSLLSMT